MDGIMKEVEARNIEIHKTIGLSNLQLSSSLSKLSNNLVSPTLFYSDKKPTSVLNNPLIISTNNSPSLLKNLLSTTNF